MKKVVDIYTKKKKPNRNKNLKPIFTSANINKPNNNVQLKRASLTFRYRDGDFGMGISVYF